MGFLSAWLGAINYTGQIYFDFAGYSNMAIGLGLMMGFHFPRNFNYPYTSCSVTEFWQRWHITLSTWFRDYLYIPLGGNRVGPVRMYLNLFVVFLLCGFWHGASWPFIIWGCYHGLFLVFERIGLKIILNRTYTPIRHIYALFVIIIGWVIFRAETLNQALAVLQRMLMTIPSKADAVFALEYLTPHYLIVAVVAIIASLPVLPRLHSHIKNRSEASNSWSTLALVGSCCLLILVAMSLASGTYNPFIYFRF